MNNIRENMALSTTKCAKLVFNIVRGPDENFLPFLGQTVSSTILKSALQCSRKIMIAVLNEQLKGLFSNSKTQEKPSSMKTRLTK